LLDLFSYIDEPIGDASIIPTYLLSAMTRKSVTVALAGEGGDELFGGYPTYVAHQLASCYLKLPSFLRRGLIEPAIDRLPVSHDNLSFDYKLKRFTKSSGFNPVSRQLRWMGSLPVETHASLLKSDYLASKALIRDNDDLVRHVDAQELGPAPDSVNTIMRLDMLTYLADDLLVKSDRASMATSLEVRLPFLAYPLVEFAVNLPDSLKVRGFTTKYLLRELARDYLPDDIIARPKKGFGIPVAKWLRKDLKPLSDELLSKDLIERQGIFQYPEIERLKKEHEQGAVDRRKELWTLLMLQMWWAKFFGPFNCPGDNSFCQSEKVALHSRTAVGANRGAGR
jgi:asparagine synthase (glutamine-hydrolysing)